MMLQRQGQAKLGKLEPEGISLYLIMPCYSCEKSLKLAYPQRLHLERGGQNERLRPPRTAR